MVSRCRLSRLSISLRSASRPEPVAAETSTAPARRASFRARCKAAASSRSALFQTSSSRSGSPSASTPSSASTALTSARWLDARVVGDVANMHDQIGLQHLFQRGAEGGDQRGRQIGDEAHGVGEHRLRAARQRQSPDGRIERGEQRVLGEHRGAGQRVEQGRLAGIGVADQRDRRIGHPLARFPMQGAGLADMLQLLADDVDALAEQPPVGLDLGLAGTAEKAEAAALPLEMGPGADQPALLIDEMGELDLQAPFPRPRALAENFEDQPGAVEHLDVPRRLEIALLHRRQRMIDDDEPGILGAHQPRQLLDLAGAEQGRRPRDSARARARSP